MRLKNKKKTRNRYTVNDVTSHRINSAGSHFNFLIAFNPLNLAQQLCISWMYIHLEYMYCCCCYCCCVNSRRFSYIIHIFDQRHFPFYNVLLNDKKWFFFLLLIDVSKEKLTGKRFHQCATLYADAVLLIKFISELKDLKFVPYSC